MQPLLASDPTHVGDYRLLGRLGKGSMGAVYLARSRGGRVVAVKVIRSDLAEDDEFRERFRREASMARSVGGFWTAAVVDTDPDAEQPWLATEYVPGPTLHRAVTDHGPLPEQSVRTLAAGLAEALRAVHRAGLVHRDLKPANVLLGPDGPRVIDFGIARATAAQGMTATGMFLGTPGFFSPEQTSGGELGPPSDVFSLGAVLTFATTGNAPFGNDSTAAMLYQVVHTDPDLSEVPDGLRPLLGACLDKEPSARPTTSTILDQLGEPNPQGDQWLPAAINATIHEHSTQLQRAARSAEPVAPVEPPNPAGAANPAAPATPQGPPSPPGAPFPQGPPNPRGMPPPVAAPNPAATPNSAGPASPPNAWGPTGTRQAGAGMAGAPSQATPDQPAAGQPDAGQAGPNWTSVARTDEISPVRPKSTAQRSTPEPAPEPLVRSDNPGPVFTTRGRVKTFVWLVIVVATIIGIYAVSDIFINQLHFRWLPGGQEATHGVVIALCAIGGLLVLRIVTPALQFKINSDGLRISRAGMSRELPWSGIERVGVVGRGKRQAVAIWVPDKHERPRSAWWHRVRRYHGGTKIFPIGAAGGWSRRKALDRVHLGLKQYSGRRYDNRLL